MSSGPVLLKRFVRNNKTDPYVDQVKLLNSNPPYANIKYPSERESTISVRDFYPPDPKQLPPESSTMEPNKSPPVVFVQEEDTASNEDVTRVQKLRRSDRKRKLPDGYEW